MNYKQLILYLDILFHHLLFSSHEFPNNTNHNNQNLKLKNGSDVDFFLRKKYKNELIPNLWQYAFYSGFKTGSNDTYYHHFSDYSQVSVADKGK